MSVPAWHHKEWTQPNRSPNHKSRKAFSHRIQKAEAIRRKRYKLNFSKLFFFLLKNIWGYENGGHRVGGVSLQRYLVYIKKPGNKTPVKRRAKKTPRETLHRVHRVAGVPVRLLCSSCLNTKWDHLEVLHTPSCSDPKGWRPVCQRAGQQKPLALPWRERKVWSVCPSSSLAVS